MNEAPGSQQSSKIFVIDAKRVRQAHLPSLSQFFFQEMSLEISINHSEQSCSLPDQAIQNQRKLVHSWATADRAVEAAAT